MSVGCRHAPSSHPRNKVVVFYGAERTRSLIGDGVGELPPVGPVWWWGWGLKYGAKTTAAAAAAVTMPDAFSIRRVGVP